jgi:hypothetical protein
MRTLFAFFIVAILTLFTVSCAKKSVCDQQSISSFLHAVGISNDTKPHVNQKKGLPFPVCEMETFFKDKEIWHLVWKKNPFAEFNFSNFSGFEACFDKETGIFVCARFIPKPLPKVKNTINDQCPIAIHKTSNKKFQWITELKSPTTTIKQALLVARNINYNNIANANEITIMNLCREKNVHQIVVKSTRFVVTRLDTYIQPTVFDAIDEMNQPKPSQPDQENSPSSNHKDQLIEVVIETKYNIDAITGAPIDRNITEKIR